MSALSTEPACLHWHGYRGTGHLGTVDELPGPRPWRLAPGEPVCEVPADDRGDADRRIGAAGGAGWVPSQHEVAMVNAAIYLRRPLLVTGRPGTGKSSLAYLIARELGLGPVLRWPVTSRTALKDGLYRYDATGRVQEINARQGEEPDVGEFVHLGPLGTALLPYGRPRVLLIDEPDKSDIDLPDDLLNVVEDGEFVIPELSRLAGRHPEVTVLTDDREGSAVVRRGRARCRSFPIVIITSNGEREFPAPFRRRCLKVYVDPPTSAQLGGLITEFMERGEATSGLASDQLLNAVYRLCSWRRPRRTNAKETGRNCSPRSGGPFVSCGGVTPG